MTYCRRVELQVLFGFSLSCSPHVLLNSKQKARECSGVQSAFLVHFAQEYCGTWEFTYHSSFQRSFQDPIKGGNE